MRIRLGWLLIVVTALVLGACSSTDEFLNRGVDYKSQGRKLPSLEIPPDLTAPSKDDRYVVPGATSATLSGYEAERKEHAVAADSTVLPSMPDMRVERDGSERWLVVQQPAEKLWPVIKEFWQENGFLLAVDLPQAGVMETDWAENRAKIDQGMVRRFLGKIVDNLYSTSERDKFRTRLERTPDGKGTEIYISHRGMEEVYKSNRTVDETVWQPRPSDPGLEAEFLRRLMVRLGAQQEKANQLAANPVNAEQKVELTGDAIKLSEPFDRAWRRVGLALDRVGFTVEDQDRDKGLYYVRYADADQPQKDKRGFLSRLFTSKGSDVKAQQYQVQVKQDPAGSQVNVLGKDGASDSSPTAKRILTLLHEQLK